MKKIDLNTVVVFVLLHPNKDENCFFYVDFLSRKFKIQRTAEEGGDYLFKTSLPLPPAS